MEILRTPDERFSELPGFDFTPHYVNVPSLPTSASQGTAVGDDQAIRIHYIDEGPPDAKETVLLMHGEPSWSYLYRKMVPVLVTSGFRVIAPDLVGFGRSDKPAERTEYTYDRHVEWMRSALFDQLGLEHLTLVCQDWGGLIGLRLVASHPERFRRVVAANTGLPTGDTGISEAFLAWQRFSQEVPEMPIGAIVRRRDTVRPARRDRSPPTTRPFPTRPTKRGRGSSLCSYPPAPDDPSSEKNRHAWTALRTLRGAFPLRLLATATPSPRVPTGCFGTCPWLQGSAARDDRRRRPLPARGPRTTTRRGGNELHRARTSRSPDRTEEGRRMGPQDPVRHDRPAAIRRSRLHRRNDRPHAGGGFPCSAAASSTDARTTRTPSACPHARR